MNTQSIGQESSCRAWPAEERTDKIGSEIPKAFHESFMYVKVPADKRD